MKNDFSVNKVKGDKRELMGVGMDIESGSCRVYGRFTDTAIAEVPCDAVVQNHRSKIPGTGRIVVWCRGAYSSGVLDGF